MDPRRKLDTVRLTVALTRPDGTAPADVRVAVRSGEAVLADVVLGWPERPRATVPLVEPARGPCRVEVSAPSRRGFVDEVSVVVRAEHGRLVERTVGYMSDGSATTRPFSLPAESAFVVVSVASVPRGKVGLPLTVMAFNIWHGGRLDGPGDDLVGENVTQLLAFIRSEDPDLLFLVETYGRGRSIERALNESQPPGRTFRGIQLTRQPERPKDKDNLWLYSSLPVVEIHPIVTTGVLTSFNLGGARLLLPDGTDLHAFTVWLYHLDDAGEATTRAALGRSVGSALAATADEIVATDHSRRMPMASELLGRLRSCVPDESATVILGGDFNTLSHLDWSADHAHAPGHGGLVLDWPVMHTFDAAGFTDTYRYANPDPISYPGDTRTGPARRYAPARIDYVLTRGERVRVLSSSLRTQRLAQHRGGPLAARYPFYSDHAAVVTDLVIRRQD